MQGHAEIADGAFEIAGGITHARAATANEGLVGLQDERIVQGCLGLAIIMGLEARIGIFEQEARAGREALLAQGLGAPFERSGFRCGFRRTQCLAGFKQRVGLRLGGGSGLGGRSRRAGLANRSRRGPGRRQRRNDKSRAAEKQTRPDDGPVKGRAMRQNGAEAPFRHQREISLACFHTRVLLVDDVDATTTTNDAAILVAELCGFEAVTDLHDNLLPGPCKTNGRRAREWWSEY